MIQFIAPAVLQILLLPANADRVVVGIIEENQCSEVHGLSARVMFLKEGNQWLRLDGQNKHFRQLDIDSIPWVVSFQGQSLGTLSIRDSNPHEQYQNAWYYTRDKVFEIVPDQHVPMIPNDSNLFGGWCSVPRFRPLVINSRPNFSDPEGWRPFSPDSSYRMLLLSPLRLVIGRLNLFHCLPGPESDSTVPFDFSADDMVFYQSYRSASGQELVGVGLPIQDYGCDGPLPSEWRETWFLLDHGRIDYLGREMTLVDIGDYDNDAKSEFLFWKSSYNLDGYVLLYNSFSDEIDYLWHYH
jgi:hypothetical protein